VIHLAIAVGGVAGAFVRHGLGAWLTGADGLPWGTLASNVCGALVLGLLMGRLQSSMVSPAVRAGLTIGFCGGFTTFSTFAYEAVALAKDARAPVAFVYVAGSLALGTAAMFAGLFAGTALARRGGGRPRVALPALGHAPAPQPGRDDAQ
jgi:fluoride exporter